MSKKKLGLSLGLASIIAVGTFASPFISSADIAANGDKTKSEEVSSNKEDKTVKKLNEKIDGAKNIIDNGVLEKAQETLRQAGLNSESNSRSVRFNRSNVQVQPVRVNNTNYKVIENNEPEIIKDQPAPVHNGGETSEDIETKQPSNDVEYDKSATKKDDVVSNDDASKDDVIKDVVVDNKKIDDKKDVIKDEVEEDYSNDSKDYSGSEEDKGQEDSYDVKEDTQIIKEEKEVVDEGANSYANQKENEYYNAKSLVGSKQAEINALEGQLYNSKPSTEEGEEGESSYNSNAEAIRGRINSLIGELEGLRANANRLQQEASQARSVANSKKRVEIVEKEVKVKVPVKKAATPKSTVKTPSRNSSSNSYKKSTNTNNSSSNYGKNTTPTYNSENTSTSNEDDIIANENAIKAKIKSAVYVRAAASSNSRILGVLQKGTEIQGVQDDYWTQVSFNGILGYVYNGYVIKTGKATGIKNISTTGSKTPVADRSANTSTNNNTSDKNNNSNKTTNPKTDSDNTDTEVKDKNSKDTGKATTGSKSAEAVAQAAYEHLGKKYVWGATGPNQFDCSGLTQYLYKNVAGVTINRVSRDQAKNGYQVSKSSLKAGDLLFFNNGSGPISHVGIYVGGGQMIHASSPTTGVIKSNVMNGYFANTFVTARRILN